MSVPPIAQKALGQILFFLTVCVAGLGPGINYRAAAQLSVGSLGLAPQAFDSAPDVSEWSMSSVGPRVAGGVISSGAQLDSVVQTNDRARVNLPLPTSSNIPPTVDGYARWNSSGHYLQTRPQTNWYTLLMATLRNDTGSNIAFITLRYDLATVMGNGINATEEIPGHRGYYSFTGATGTWIRVPQFDSPTATDTSPKVATLNLGVWPQNAFLYLLWADVNAIAATAGANQEGGYTIDNFQAAASPAQSGFPSIVSQPTAQTLGYPNQAAFSVEALGSMPLFYQWFKDGALLNGATNSTLTIHNANATQQGSYAVSVSNSFGAVLSSNAPLTVECVGATSVVITNQPSGQSLNSGGTIALTVGVSGSSPLTFQWHRDGLPIVGANSSNYVKAIAQAADSGFYSVIAGNCAGAMTSSVAFIQVIGAPYGLVGLTNHFWRYNQSGTNLGTAWKEVDYDDPSWPSGRGILAREDNAFITPLTNTVLSVTNAAGAGIVTHYFRTTFVVTNDPSLVSLMASNYIDDGAVVYVNGLEAFRYNMPAGDPSNTTTALAANPLGEGVPIVSNIPPNLTVRGTNVLAVEVHQNTSLSTDVVFGLALLGRDLPPGPPAIAVHPASRTVFEGQGLTLSVTLAAGHDSRFQWLKEGVALLSATNSTLLLTNVSFLEAGRYLLTVSNAYGMVTSSVATVNVIGGEAKLRLVEFTNAWRFNQSGPNLGTAWRAPAYDDASWESGPGVLLNSQYDGFPEPTNRVLSLTNSSGTVVTTYYFRVHFALPPGISNVVLSASNLLDDGAVFYVNGFEATRLRMNGVVTATTFAGFALTDGLAYESFLFAPTNLVSGDNVLAVEVHQTSSMSSDIVFGMNLFGYGAFDEPVSIISPLTPQTVVEGTPTTLHADVIGAERLYFQWFHKGVALPAGTNITLHIPATHEANAGNYFFVASNALNAVTSSVAALTVIADFAAPTVVAAFGTNGNAGIMVIFSEDIAPESATNLAHYSVSPFVSILGAFLVAPNRVLLTTSGLNIQSSYTLAISNVYDLADNPNAIIPAAVHVQPNRLTTATGLLRVRTVFIILMENQSWSAIKGSPECPYINSLLPFASYCENYSSPGNIRRSEPNYLWLEAGDHFGYTEDFGPSIDRVATTNHLSTQLFNAGIEWRGYMEDLPYGSTGVSSANEYLAHHNPFAFFDDVTTNYDYCTNHVRPYAEFAGDLAAGRIGRYNFISPNRTNGMRTLGLGSTSAKKQGDDWLARELPRILASSAFTNDGAVFIAFDETDFDTNKNIGMILLSPLAKGGGYASFVPYDHSSTLRTMQEVFDVRPFLGAAANASPLNDLFKTFSLRPSWTNSSFALRLDAVLPGWTYYVQASSDMENWNTISTNAVMQDVIIVDPAAPVQPRRFYRVIAQPRIVWARSLTQCEFEP